MPVLADLFSLGNRVRRKLGDLLNDPVGVLQQSVDNVMPTGYEQRQLFDSQRGQQANPAAVASAQQKMDALARDAALNAITVWHGSPHKFDKFDMSKIGTGEGAQAYGHGLYFAESPDVAGSYAANLTTSPVKIDGAPITSVIQDANAQRFLQEANGNLSLAKERAKKEWMYFKKVEPSATKRGFVEEAMKQLDQLQGKAIEAPGALYKVDLPDEAVARFLDWDKPLSQQAPEVQAAIAKVHDTDLPTFLDMMKLDPFRFDKTGKEFYDSFARAESRKGNGMAAQSGVSNLLSGNGIPGIRYLDGGSRGAGTGTSNFVVFDDQLPTILERNGIPLSSLLGK